jgi:hypothetical protein
LRQGSRLTTSTLNFFSFFLKVVFSLYSLDKSRLNGKPEGSSNGTAKHLQQLNGKHHHSMRFNSRIKKDFARLSHDLGIGVSLGLNEVTRPKSKKKSDFVKISVGDLDPYVLGVPNLDPLVKRCGSGSRSFPFLIKVLS